VSAAKEEARLAAREEALLIAELEAAKVIYTSLYIYIY